jgi:hypothetical protein
VADLANTVKSISPDKPLSTLFSSSTLVVLDSSSKFAPQPENLSTVPSLVDDLLAGTAAALKPGESTAERDARIQAATATANDLSGLVRHKKKPVEANDTSMASAEGNGKRKAEEVVVDGAEGKKVKFDV